MRANKLVKYAELKTFGNVFEFISNGNSEVADLSVWDALPLAKKNRLTVELGCGRGELTVAAAISASEAMHIGIDIKGARLWHGAKAAAELGLSNAAFIRMQIEDIAKLFPPLSVDEFWLPFPDPRSKSPGKNAKHRLVAPIFLRRYASIAKSGALLRLKTDDSALFDYALDSAASENLQLVRASRDIYADGILSGDSFAAQTKYERKYVLAGKAIMYACFQM